MTKRHWLNKERAALMARSQQEMPNPVDNVAKVAEMATKLQKNAAEDHQMLYSMSRATYCGVRLPRTAKTFISSIYRVHS